MDDLSTMIFRPGTLVLAVAIYVTTLIIRRVVETARPDLKRQASEMEQKSMYTGKLAVWWNEVVLYTLPVIVGCAAAALESEFVFGNLSSKDRLMFACGVGWFSGTLYKTVRKMLMAKAGVQEPGRDSQPPLSL